MKIVVGLGNPGAEYLDTPHNVGFQAIDVLARRAQTDFSRQLRFRALTAKVMLNGDSMLLVKPVTFMNRSGSAVSLLMQFYKADVSDLLVIVDDVNLQPGRLRVRPGGRSGGHRGLDSIISAIGTDAFARIRVGVGEPRRETDLVSHVLSPLRGDALERFRAATVDAADAAMCCIEQSVAVAMNTYNGRNPDENGDA